MLHFRLVDEILYRVTWASQHWELSKVHGNHPGSRPKCKFLFPTKSLKPWMGIPGNAVASQITPGDLFWNSSSETYLCKTSCILKDKEANIIKRIVLIFCPLSLSPWFIYLHELLEQLVSRILADSLNVLCNIDDSWGHSAEKAILKCTSYRLENLVCRMCLLTDFFLWSEICCSLFRFSHTLFSCSKYSS